MKEKILGQGNSICKTTVMWDRNCGVFKQCSISTEKEEGVNTSLSSPVMLEAKLGLTDLIISFSRHSFQRLGIQDQMGWETWMFCVTSKQ